MQPTIEHFAHHLANDATVSDDEIVQHIRSLRRVTRGTRIVDFEQFKLLRVLELCGERRELPIEPHRAETSAGRRRKW